MALDADCKITQPLIGANQSIPRNHKEDVSLYNADILASLL